MFLTLLLVNLLRLLLIDLRLILLLGHTLAIAQHPIRVIVIVMHLFVFHDDRVDKAAWIHGILVSNIGNINFHLVFLISVVIF